MQVFFFFGSPRRFKEPIMTLKLNFEKIKFQNRGISLISLGKEAKCWIFYTKGAKANFPLQWCIDKWIVGLVLHM